MKQKTVFVTGSSRGIGRSIAEKFAKEGHRVVLHCHRNEEMLDELYQSLWASGADVMKVQGDISSVSDVERMFREIWNRFGFVEVLVCNAGVALPQMLLTDCTLEELENVIDINLKGSILCARQAVPGMVSKKNGSIVFVSSYLGVVGGSCEVPYSASKAGLNGLTKALAKELAPSGIRVNAVAPGFVLTDMNAHFSKENLSLILADIPLGRFGTPEEIAESVYYLSDEDCSGFITGQILCVDGGISIS